MGIIDLSWIGKVFKSETANITVSTAFDRNYLDYGKILLRSIWQNSPEVQIKLLVVNTPEEDLKEFLKHPNLEIFRENIDFLHPYEQRLYVMARRIFFVNQLRQDPNIENLLQLDADLIVRKDLNKFGKLYQQGDFLIFARPKMKHAELRLNMSVLGLANTDKAKALTQEWAAQFRDVAQESLDSKYVDQLTLWHAYEKISDEKGIQLVNLDRPYIGEDGNTCIRVFFATRTAKGNSKLLNELNQYADSQLAEAPSNAPPNPQEGGVFLRKELLLDRLNNQ
jgi:lipopolysaccharide biosynthesis glycosyltransferase